MVFTVRIPVNDVACSCMCYGAGLLCEMTNVLATLAVDLIVVQDVFLGICRIPGSGIDIGLLGN